VKVGDLVKHVFSHRRENMIGIILGKWKDPMAMNNDVFNVLWHDGSIGNNVWDYDLVAINASR